MKKVLKALYSYLPFKRQLFLLLKNFWLPPPHIYQHLYFSGVFNVELANGISFKVDHFGQQIENRGISLERAHATPPAHEPAQHGRKVADIGTDLDDRHALPN